MARIAGIKFEKDTKGNKRYVRIDLKKHSETLAPILKQLGILNDQVDKDEAAYREKFYKDRANGITLEELRTHLYGVIESLPWKRKEIARHSKQAKTAFKAGKLPAFDAKNVISRLN